MHCSSDFQLKCRICGQIAKRCLDIHGTYRKGDKIVLLELIFKYLDLQVKQDDGLPQRVCNVCAKKLAAWQTFRTKCHQTQTRLSRVLAKSSSAVSRTKDSHVETTIRSRKRITSRCERRKPEKSKGEEEPKKEELTHKKVGDDGFVVGMERNSELDPSPLVDSEETKDDMSKGPVPIKKMAAEKRSKKRIQSKKKRMKKRDCEDSGSKPLTDLRDVMETKSQDESETKEELKEDTDAREEEKTEDTGTTTSCTTCHMLFRDSDSLARHISTQHTEHRCPVCKKLFKNKFSLRSHQFVHAERRHFCCHVCGRLFRTASCLCNHVRAQHSGEGQQRPFECPHCSKRFGQRYHFAQHMRSHTGERPFACPECSLRFTTRCQLTRHQRGRHQRDARFVCDICDRRFRYSSNYKVHLQAHQGHTLQCADCDRSFSSSNGLLRHRRLHTGEKPFPCSICGKRFADCSNRKRHMLRHAAGPRPPRAPRNKKTSAASANALVSTNVPASFLTASASSLPLCSAAIIQCPSTGGVSLLASSTNSLTPATADVSVPSVTTPLSDDIRSFSSLRAFLESSEVAALADSAQMTSMGPPPLVPITPQQTGSLSSAQPSTEMLTLLTAGDGGVQQVILLPAGLLDAMEVETAPTQPSLALPPVSTPPNTLLDKEAIVRMLNSQGTTIA